MLERKGPSNMAVINLQDGKPRLGICTILGGIQKLRGQYFGSFLTTYLTILNSTALYFIIENPPKNEF